MMIAAAPHSRTLAAAAFGLALAATSATLGVQPASARSCGDEIQQIAQQHHLSLSPTGPAQGPNTAEAPSTSESRGVAAGPDSLSSSGGTLPPSTGSSTEKSGAAADKLGAADRAKVEGLLSDARAADGKGDSSNCLARLAEVQAMLRQIGH